MADHEMSRIKKLKLEMKRWEKHFEQVNGRKARREDIDKDEKMKQTYIRYWKVIKNKGAKSTKVLANCSQSEINCSQKKMISMDNVWGSDLNKSCVEAKSSFLSDSNKKPLSRLSTKIMQMSNKNTAGPTLVKKSCFSLNKKSKMKDLTSVSSVIINSNSVSLFKKPESKSIDSEDIFGSAMDGIISSSESTREQFKDELVTDNSSHVSDILSQSDEKDSFKAEINNIIDKLHDDEFSNPASVFIDDDKFFETCPFEINSVLSNESIPMPTGPSMTSPVATSVTSVFDLDQRTVQNSYEQINSFPAQQVPFTHFNPINSMPNIQTTYSFDPYQQEPQLPSSYASMTSDNTFAQPSYTGSNFSYTEPSLVDQSFEFANLIPSMLEKMNSNVPTFSDVHYEQEHSDVHTFSETAPTHYNMENMTSNSFISIPASTTYSDLDSRTDYTSFTNTCFTTNSSGFVSDFTTERTNQSESTDDFNQTTRLFTPVKNRRPHASDMEMEFSPIKDSLLTSSSLVDQVNLFNMVPGNGKPKKSLQRKSTSDTEDLFKNSSDDEDVPVEAFEGVTTASQTALFDINLEPSKKNHTAKSVTKKVRRQKNDENADDDEDETKDYDNGRRKDVKTLTKQRKRNTQKDANFRRLEFKKKVYSRGHKKFNTTNYKRNQWKQLQSSRGSGCFKCGDPNHWAQDCLKEAIMDDHIFDAELEELAIEKNVDNLSVLPTQGEQRLILDNPEAEVNQALIELGFEEFKSNQKETILRILSGRSVLMISSTGSGKSLCYQLPAYLYGKKRNYITLVISPLISLMEDQILCLPNALKGCYLHSGLTESMKRKQIEQIQNGQAHLLFLSPEYIMGNLLELSLLPPIAFVCIDEAHCLSEWSNNFRPSYLQLFKTLKLRLGIKTFLALTATANKHTARQIVRNLGIDFSDLIGQTRIPENLMLTASRDGNKDFALIDLLKSERFNSLKSIIVYCNRREVTERLATLIRIEMKNILRPNSDQWSACAYHAGLSYQTRKDIQNRFIRGELRVIVATIAFGMGINKSDVSAIIHYNLPKTFENYVQEVGRAGRDGRRAECHLFLDQDGSDLFEQQKHIYANGVDRSNIRKFVNKLFKPCKCRQLNSVDSEEEGENQKKFENLVPHRRCPGHEKAFSIKDTTQELDLKEETILTLLLFLELNCKFKVNVLNYTNSNCRLFCYRGGAEELEQLAKQHPFVAIPLAHHKQKTGRPFKPDLLEFSYVDVASMLGQESILIRRRLKSLEWEPSTSSNKKVRSSVRVEFSDLSFHMTTPGDLSEDELDQVSRMLLNYSRAQENKEIESLKHMYETFRELSQQRCTNKINSVKSRELKRVLNEYFDLCNIDQNSGHEECFEQMMSQASQPVELRPINDAELNEARSSIISLIRLHQDQNFTPRAVARILQGIASPKYPLDIWGKDKRFWRRCLRVDFNQLVKLATEELVRYKC